MKLTKEQKAAKKFALKGKKDKMITGEGGTGKSHILIDIYKNTNCDVAAYTHAAKNRLRKDGVANASTIASLIGKKVEVNFAIKDENDPFFIDDGGNGGNGGKLLLLDECSMAPASDIERLKEKYDKIIFFGDVVQLPPPQGRMYDFDKVKQFTLEKNHRSNKKLLKKIRKNRKSSSLKHYDKIGLDEIEKRLKSGEDLRIICGKNEDVDRFNKLFGKYTKSLINNNVNVRKNNIEVLNGDILDDYTIYGRKLPYNISFSKAGVYAMTPCNGLPGFEEVEYIQIEGVVFEFVKSKETLERLRKLATSEWIEFRNHHKLMPEHNPNEWRILKAKKGHMFTEKKLMSEFVQMKYYQKKLKGNWQWSNFITLLKQTLVLKPTIALTAHKAQGQTFDSVVVVKDDRMIGHNLKVTYVSVSRAKNNVWVLK